MKNSQNPKHMLFSALKIAPLVAVAALFLAVFAACIFPSADFSAYQGANLIASKQFAVAAASPDSGWTPDEAALSAYTSAVNMWYEPVSSAAGLNESGDSFGGYGDEATLRSGLPGLGDGSATPIFRLETKNLFINGDFEAADIIATDNILATRRSRVSANSLGDIAFDFRGNWMQLDFQGGSASVLMRLASNVSGHTDDTVERSYSFSFRFALDTDPTKYWAVDNAADNSPSASSLAILNKPARSKYRFPFTVFLDDAGQSLDESGIVTSTSGDKQYLVINPQRGFNNLNNGAIVANPMKGSIDDIEMVRTALPNAVRINVPWSDSGRPILQRGGTYTVKVWVRTDNTNNYSAGTPKVPNRFAADFLSISLHPYTSTTSQIPEVGTVVTSSVDMSGSTVGDRAGREGWTNYPDWNSWTLLSASFKNQITLADSSVSVYPLQIALSTTNMGSSNFRSAGSVLVANPQLYWNED